jgi:hypothetical protein
LGQIA